MKYFIDLLDKDDDSSSVAVVPYDIQTDEVKQRVNLDFIFEAKNNEEAKIEAEKLINPIKSIP